MGKHSQDERDDAFRNSANGKIANQAIDNCDEVIRRQIVEEKARNIAVKRFGHDGKKPR